MPGFKSSLRHVAVASDLGRKDINEASHLSVTTNVNEDKDESGDCEKGCQSHKCLMYLQYKHW